jgi:hypothetical protein
VTFSPVFLALAPLYRAEVLSDVIGLLEREYRAAYDQIGPGAANLPDLPEPRRTGEAKQQLDPRLRGPAEGEA